MWFMLYSEYNQESIGGFPLCGTLSAMKCIFARIIVRIRVVCAAPHKSGFHNATKRPFRNQRVASFIFKIP